jgi:hypothetical protein
MFFTINWPQPEAPTAHFERARELLARYARPPLSMEVPTKGGGLPGIGRGWEELRGQFIHKGVQIQNNATINQGFL